MSTPSLSSGDVSALIDHLLKAKDPASIGVRKILKSKMEHADDFPLQSLEYEEFFVQGRSKEQFTEQEKHVLEMEKKVRVLEATLISREEKYKTAIAEALEQGMREGFIKGEEEGRKTAKTSYDEQVRELQKRIASFLGALETSKKSIYNNAHSILLRLCFELAKNIVHTEITANPHVVLAVIKKCLSYIADREKIVVRVAKDDLETVSKKKEFWLPISERVDTISIEPDERIEKGGCIIESNSGIADGRLGTQMAELHELVDRIWQGVVSSPEGSPG
jgi:flagellar biosynthesis/type III secretory pathway protein FliH